MERTVVTIGPDGQVRVEATGQPGEKCLEGLRTVEASLGARAECELTEEYYQTNPEQQRQR